MAADRTCRTKCKPSASPRSHLTPFGAFRYHTAHLLINEGHPCPHKLLLAKVWKSLSESEKKKWDGIANRMVQDQNHDKELELTEGRVGNVRGGCDVNELTGRLGKFGLGEEKKRRVSPYQLSVEAARQRQEWREAVRPGANQHPVPTAPSNNSINAAASQYHLPVPSQQQSIPQIPADRASLRPASRFISTPSKQLQRPHKPSSLVLSSLNEDIEHGNLNSSRWMDVDTPFLPKTTSTPRASRVHFVDSEPKTKGREEEDIVYAESMSPFIDPKSPYASTAPVVEEDEEERRDGSEDGEYSPAGPCFVSTSFLSQKLLTYMNVDSRWIQVRRDRD